MVLLNHIFPNSNLVATTLFVMVFVLSSLPVQGATRYWTGTNTLYPPTSAQNWNSASNWDTPPVPTDDARIQNGGSVLIDDTQTVNEFLIGNSGWNTRSLHIAYGGTLNVTSTSTSAFRQFNTSGNHLVSIAAGGNLNVAGYLKNGSITAGSPSLISTAGNVSVGAYSSSANSQLIISGGKFYVSGGIEFGTNCNILMTGGNLASPNYLRMPEGSTVTILGGNVNLLSATQGLFWWGFVDDATDPRILHISGSGAGNITFGGLRYYQPEDKAGAVWRFTLDNGANHITSIQFQNDGIATGALREGTLDVRLAGGILASSGNTFDLIEAPTINSGTDFATQPTSLWSQNKVDLANGRDAVRITLSENSKKGTLSLGQSLSFTGSGNGFVALSGMERESTLYMLLDIDGGTLSNLTSALSSANITWRTGNYGAYELQLNINATTAGGNYFSWDFKNIDASMKVQGLKSHLSSRPLFFVQ